MDKKLWYSPIAVGLNEQQLLIAILMTERRSQVHTVWIHLYKVQKQAKWNNIVRNTDVSGNTIKKSKEIAVTKIRRRLTSRGWIWLTGNGHTGVFWGPGWQCFVLWRGDVYVNGCHYSCLPSPTTYWALLKKNSSLLGLMLDF